MAGPPHSNQVDPVNNYLVYHNAVIYRVIQNTSTLLKEVVWDIFGVEIYIRYFPDLSRFTSYKVLRLISVLLL
jgi:hypothetical protein